MNSQPGKIPCSVGILTLNSAKTLPRCLESVKDFGEIIICDGNSTDETLKIAQEFGCKIVKQYDSDEPNLKIKDYSEVRNKTVKASSYDWFFQLDSDEYLSKGLAEEIAGIVLQIKPEHQIYRLPGKLIYEDRIIEHCSSYPGYQFRFFNKQTGAYYIKTIHERLEFDRTKFSIGTLKNLWCIPFNRDELNEFWQNYRRYIDMEIKREYRKPTAYFIIHDLIKRPLKIIKLILTIIYIYLRYGFKDTLPPIAEFQRIYYASYLLMAIVVARLKFIFHKN